VQRWFGGGQVIAVEDAHPVAGDDFRQHAAEMLDNRPQTAGRVADQFGGDGVFDALQLVVDGGKRDRDVNDLVHISSADGVVSAGDDHTHQIDDIRKQQFASVLLVGLTLEQLVQLFGTERAFKDGARHHCKGTSLHESFKDRLQQHRLPPDLEFLSCYWTSS
jgi:hypothetical protein